MVAIPAGVAMSVRFRFSACQSTVTKNEHVRDEVSSLLAAGRAAGFALALLSNLTTPPSSAAHLSAHTTSPAACATSNPLPHRGSSNASCPIQRQLTVNSHSNAR